MEFPKQELIEDREIAKFDDDLLGHQDIASQLAVLVQSVPTPSNIALYGAWGSGKSGIGNMLAEHLGAEGGTRFARFDAFKYAENPLRRNFVSIVATALDNKDSKYHEDLYTGRTNTDFRVPFRKLLHLLAIFALIVFVCAIVASVAVSIVAVLQGKDPVAELLTIGASTLPASLVPASLLTAVIALVGKTFVVEKRVERAESDEEFEALLRELVNSSGASRVVIFVDELDRCSSDDVVETLNAVRTFLGVGRCVFVVAADQQVLEHALTESLAQPTPADTVNPYYSAGSAYLDKVFQYQVSVPPLMPQSVTSFAVSLIDGRPGVWQRVDVRVVASILIPAHVRSPRRVKNLLNAFVLTYRLAQSRRTSGQLDLDVDTCVDELARLVCLRVEFPLFARDLVTDPSLSDYVRELADSESQNSEVWKKYPYVDQRTRDVAEAYARGTRAVDKLLVDGDETSRSDLASEITKVQGQQLINYLSRTRLVAGPTKALIHLQNSATIFGLATTVAEQLEFDAQNASVGSIRQVYEGLDPDGRGAVMDLLVQQARAAVGLEAPNVATSILAVAPLDESVLISHADSICVVVAEAAIRNPELLTEATVHGAWQLALSSTRPEARELGTLVLESDLAEEDDELFGALIRSGDRAVTYASERVTQLLIDKLFGDDLAWVIDLLLEIEDNSRSAILGAAASEVMSRLTESIQTAEAEKAAATTTTTTSARRTVPSSQPSEDGEYLEESSDPSMILKELGRLLDGVKAYEATAETLLRVLLGTGSRAARDILEPLLPALQIEDIDTMRMVASQARVRAVGNWPTWLSRLSSKQMMAQPSTRAPILALVEALWALAMSGKPVSDVGLREGASAVVRLLDEADQAFIEQVQISAIQLGASVEEEEDIATHQRRVQVATQLADAGLAMREEVMRQQVGSLAETLAKEIEAQDVESAITEYVIVGSEEALTRHSSEGESLPRATIQALVDSLASNNWMSEFDRARLTAMVTAFAGEDADTSALDVLDTRTVMSYKADLSATAFDQLLRYWLRSSTQTVTDVLSVLRPHLLAKPSDALLQETEVWAKRLSADEQYTVLASFIASAGTSLPANTVLGAIGVSRISDGDVISILVDRFGRETSNPGRQRVLELWRAAQITDVLARKRALREIMIPLVGLNAQATRMALSFLPELAVPIPSGLRKTLADAVVAATRGQNGLEDLGRRALSELGFNVERKGLFGLRKEVDTSG